MQIDLKKFIESMYKYGQADLSYSNAMVYALADQGYKIDDEHHVVPVEEIKGNNGGISHKFEVGDWVVWDGFYHLIEGISSEGYICEKGKIAFDVEKDLHLWSIADAKDGDVLRLQKDGKEHIIIYKGVIKERFRTFVSAYCAYNGIVDAFCFADVSRYVDIAYGGIMPATKEQLDLLFAKMHEAGYEWDAEKKELKKIEQKPVENKGMNLVEEEMTPFQKKVFCIVDTAIEEEQGLSNICNELLALAKQEIEQKQEEPASEDLPHIRHRDTLDEFAYQCAYNLSNDWAKETPEWNDIKTACKLGAQWKEEQMMAKGLLDIGIEFLREYINATPEERQRFTSQINDMACSSDEILEAAKKLREIAREIKKED